ncbi:Coiled-coil domain-containing protein 12 [Xenotaenia resolanae]|uniref:Coiled-coil domain-containing protein 12 n=1 Tax=Xenotaenia resolanae TaxID=208358 RepID=A0ABV0X1Y1_9TELE
MSDGPLCSLIRLHCHLLDCPVCEDVHQSFICFSVPRELKLRNYTPEDEELKERQVPKAKPASVEDKVKDQLEAANPEPIIEEVDLANLAPRKPDWDLKRDVAKKLEKLERRTQRAIAELIR